MQYTDKLFLALLTSLTLFLAGCGGSSSTSMVNKEPTELEKAQQAAEAAKNAAMTASTNADTEADKADESVMSIVVLQTGSKGDTAKMDAAAARTAANAAMSAYETAKAQYDRAKATDNLTAAVEAKLAAEAAKREADKQAAMAAEKAKMAVDAASMVLKVSADGKTYSVGDVSITAGSPKKTATRDGVTRTTGKIEDIVRKGDSDRSAVTYSAGPPETRAQPVVEKRNIALGVSTDSDDDTVRLELVDRYVTLESNKMVSIFRDRGNTDQTATASGANPYGTVTVSGKAVPIMRVQGEFYMVSGTAELTKQNANRATIAANTKDANAATGLGGGIYYYMEGNTKKWLRLNRSSTDTGGAVTLTYDNISVYENARFPEAKLYKHINFGTWTPLKEDGNTYAGLGVGFVSALPGKAVTPPANIPVGGIVTYFGQAQYTMQNRADHSSEPGKINSWTSGATTTVDFNKSTIKADIGISGTFSGMIDGNSFSGAKISDITDTDINTDSSVYTVEFRGNIFGPKFEEVGGVFSVTSENMKHGGFQGSFGGIDKERQ